MGPSVSDLGWILLLLSCNKYKLHALKCLAKLWWFAKLPNDEKLWRWQQWAKAIDEYISFLLIAGSNVCQDADWQLHFKISVEFRISIISIVEIRNEKDSFWHWSHRKFKPPFPPIEWWLSNLTLIIGGHICTSMLVTLSQKNTGTHNVVFLFRPKSPQIRA